MTAPLLDVRALRTEFPSRGGVVQAVRGVDFSVSEGEVVGLVGESGSGKSVFLRSLLRLITPPGRIADGEIRFGDRDVLRATDKELRHLRGGEIALIPQDPANALNPSLTVGFQMTRVLRLHRQVQPQDGWSGEAELMLKKVGVQAPGVLRRYGFNFSQGQLQRVMTAMAVLSGRPRLLLADEPTTSLDVTIAAQILWLISQLQREIGLAVVLVTHDLGVIAQMADRVAVMYAGRIVEDAAAVQLFARPAHPYTIGLLRSSQGFVDGSSKRLYAMPGVPPDMAAVGPGCTFAPRCPWATEICTAVTPSLRSFAGSRVACHNAEIVAGAVRNG
jgi:oligopeptide transport system ATP-binding protein